MLAGTWAGDRGRMALLAATVAAAVLAVVIASQLPRLLPSNTGSSPQPSVLPTMEPSPSFTVSPQPTEPATESAEPRHRQATTRTTAPAHRPERTARQGRQPLRQAVTTIPVRAAVEVAATMEAATPDRAVAAAAARAHLTAAAQAGIRVRVAEGLGRLEPARLVRQANLGQHIGANRAELQTLDQPFDPIGRGIVVEGVRCRVQVALRTLRRINQLADRPPAPRRQPSRTAGRGGWNPRCRSQPSRRGAP